MRRKLKLILLALGLLALTEVAGARAQGESWLAQGQRAVEEYRAKNYAAFLEHIERAARAAPPRMPWLMYQLARAYSLNGRAAEAARVLEELAAAGLGPDVSAHDDFKALRAAEAWGPLSQKLDAARAPVVRSRTAHVIPEPDLLPEGIAYDSRRRTLYLGSVRGKIVRLEMDGRRGDFKALGEDGLESVLGMKVDAARRLLWVCNNTRDGAAFVHKYHLDTGRLLKKYALDERPARRQFNDLALTRRGDAYVTDSLGAAVYEIPAAADELRPFVKFEPGLYPNGVALSADERLLYVANVEGISVVNLATRKRALLSHPDNVVVTGVDGLYLYRGGLVAVQNALPAPARVVRLFLGAGGARVERATIVESNHPAYALPTTGALVGDEFFYVANTQIDSMGSDGKISPTAKLRDLILLRLRLN